MPMLFKPTSSKKCKISNIHRFRIRQKTISQFRKKQPKFSTSRANPGASIRHFDSQIAKFPPPDVVLRGICRLLFI